MSLGFDLFPIQGPSSILQRRSRSLGVQHDAQPLGGVSTDGLDPEGRERRARLDGHLRPTN